MEPPRAGSDWFRVEDLNFDGYRDIYLLTTWGATGNYGGCGVWLYDPKTGLFDYSKEFSELNIRSVDPQTRTLYSIWNLNATDWHEETYAVKNNHPVLIRSFMQTSDIATGKIHCATEEMRGGRLEHFRT